MAIYKLELDYQARYTEEQKDLLCSHYNLDATTWEYDEHKELWKPQYSWSIEIKDDPLVFKAMFPAISIKIGKVVETTQALEIVHILRRMEDKLTAAMARPREAGVPAKETYQSDGKTRVAMPEWFIAHIKTVQVFTNYCTEALQSELNDGWHILAICPQPGQRRPDYICGKL